MKKGFTLIELLIVVAIVGIIGLAVFSTAKNPSSITTSTKQEVVLPEATGYVIDNAGVLKEETRQKIESTLKALDSTAQVAVVTVKTTKPMDEKQYSIKLAEKWKPGYKGKDNGVIFLIVTEDRKVRIEVGRGLESIINDAKAGRILDESVVPFLKNNDWDGGVMSGVEAISQEVKNYEQ
jgi:uncharacterized protein